MPQQSKGTVEVRYLSTINSQPVLTAATLPLAQRALLVQALVPHSVNAVLLRQYQWRGVSVRWWR